MTKRMTDFLQWVQTQGTVSMFPMEWSAIRKKADKSGLIERVGVEQGRFGLVKFSLSEKGKAALQ